MMCRALRRTIDQFSFALRGPRLVQFSAACCMTTLLKTDHGLKERFRCRICLNEGRLEVTHGSLSSNTAWSLLGGGVLKQTQQSVKHTVYIAGNVSREFNFAKFIQRACARTMCEWLVSKQ